MFGVVLLLVAATSTADKKPDANMLEAKEAAVVATEAAAAEAAEQSS